MLAAREEASCRVDQISIEQTREALRAGRTSCRQLVEAYLARIHAYDQSTHLNSIVLVNPDALSDADRLDAEFAQTRVLRPLECVAVIVKDNYDTAGLQTTGGSLALKGFQPATDAFMVKRLREAGAIILAKSNMAEWAFSPYVTVSSIAGITRNAYALDRVPAGSSGGTAAAVAADFGEVGLGTDTGNSIRGPSSHNDLVGIRPTIGLTSRDGIIPLFANNDVGGPMARSVADAAAMLTVVAGYDAADPITESGKQRAGVDYTKYLDRGGLKGARIGVFRRYVDGKAADPQVQALFERAIADLRGQGAAVIDPVDLPDYKELTRNLWCGDFQADLNTYFARHGQGAPYTTLQQIVASGLYLPYIEEELKGAAGSKVDPGERRSPCPDVYHDPPKIAFRAALLGLMNKENLDAIIYPTWGYPPRKIGDMESPAGDNSQVLSPQTGFPAVTVPMGFTYGSLPAGLTFLGRSLSEPTLIRLTYAYEQATKHHTAPSGFAPLAGQQAQCR